MTRAAIVQARHGSTRLPAKVVMDLAGRPVLRHVLERCAEVPGIDVVVCAIPEAPVNDPVAEIARGCGVRVFRGSENDVLARYIGAARMVGAEIVLRVTSDCPLIDPDVCGRVMAKLVASSADYASNVAPRSFPQGLDCEAFRAATLDEAARSPLAIDHEHVTPWHRKAAHIARVNLLSGRPGLADLRWTLDFPEDLAFLRAVFVHLPRDRHARMDDVLAVLQAHPELAAINACRRETEFVASWKQGEQPRAETSGSPHR